MNTGCTRPMPFPRGRDTFLSLDEYPYEERRKRGLEPVVELSILGGVPDIAEFTKRVVRMRGDTELRVIWRT